MYPAGPATIQPTANPAIILIFLRNGEPNNSINTIVTNDKNPRPINSGEPHGRGLGAKMVGQRAKMPVGFGSEQELEPPAQLGAPEEPISEAPIKRMTIPVSKGGGEGRLECE
jgi:hypothetical protein